MKVAILGSVTTKIPPDGQAAIERLAYQQALGLAQRGHTVLLFALRGSHVEHPSVTLIEVGEGDVRSGAGEGELISKHAFDNVILEQDPAKPDEARGSQMRFYRPSASRITTPEEPYGISYKLRLEIVNLAHVLDQLDVHKDEYEVILNNIRGEAVLLGTAVRLHKPFYHILHLPIFPQLSYLFKKYQTKLISISNAQQRANPGLSYAGTVYNAVDTNEFAFHATPEDYVLYLGSIGRNKNPHEAIVAAKQSGVRIKIGGRIKDQAYYEEKIAPHIDNDQVQWVGERTVSEVVKLYQNARAFLFPTLWEEPFGLVLIEAMSCGTPVIAYPNGAIPEIVEDGRNGYLVQNVSEMAQKVKEIDKIDRAACRVSVEVKFSLEKMIEGYEALLRRTRSKQKRSY